MSRESNSLTNLLFDPSLSRNRKNQAPIREQTMNSIEMIEGNLTSSFRYDSPGSALKSSQQLNIDFSRFENHTFFNSAQAKVQKAFGKIINSYPFDGTKDEIDRFLDNLTGFEKYVFDAIPHYVGYLNFSGSTGVGTIQGSYMSVKDFQGTFSPSLSRSTSGISVLDFGTGPFTTEFFINVPSGTINENSIILQKSSGSNGLTVALSSSYNTASPQGSVPLLCILSSGSLSLTSSMNISKGKFEHCAIVYDKSAGAGQLKLYNNANLIASSAFGTLGQIDFVTSPLTIGSGSNVNAKSYTFVVSSTLSGALDELRFWHKAKTQKEIYSEQFKNVFASPQLKLLYRFNEPTGSFQAGGSDLILDHSGNGLHARVQNFSSTFRSKNVLGSPPLTSENLLYSPVLFPSFSDTVNFNSTLLTSASDYDYNNPNLVTKLIPPHYLEEAKLVEGFENVEGDIGNEIDEFADQPGGARIGQPQIIASLMYVMAESFDELKMLVDEFKRLLKVDVISKDTISDQLLPWLGRYYGIKLPNMFAGASIQQSLEGSNVTLSGKNTDSLQKIQNTIWRRIFSDLPHMLATRGTMESIRATIRNMGINPDGPVKIRELGGSNSYLLGDSFLKRQEVAAMLDFSGSIGKVLTSTDAQGFSSIVPHITGVFLSGTRNEPGVPNISGTLVGSNRIPASSDGLFTSGSWSFEATYKISTDVTQPTRQSLVRLMTTGTSSPASTGMILFNLVANAANLETATTGSIQLWGHPNASSSGNTMLLQLTGVNIFDNNKWQVSFGRQRNDSFEMNYTTSSYFLRASKFTPGGLEEFITTSSFINENLSASESLNMLQNLNSSYNASGSFLVIGGQNITANAGGLNDSSISSIARTTTFAGKVSGIRFWSKALSETESKMHAKNFKSLGVDDPSTNFNFVNSTSGSFEKIRMDVSTDQILTSSDSGGKILLTDFSQNSFEMTGLGFDASSQVIRPEKFDYLVLSSDFKSESPNKIRVRSYQNSALANLENVSVAPLYNIPQNEQPKDDKRIQIEVQAIQSLNEDMMNIFSTLDYLDNAIGSPELVFAQEYPTLRHLRRIYFNRLTDKVNFIQVFQFFKWFDETIGDYLEQLLPYDSKFLGTSFIIEPHALERPKFVYNYYDLYLGEENRGGKEIILLQQIVGNIRKF